MSLASRMSGKKPSSEKGLKRGLLGSRKGSMGRQDSMGSMDSYGYAPYNPYGGYGGYGSMYNAPQTPGYGYAPYGMQSGGSMYYGGSMYAPQPAAQTQPSGGVYVVHSDGYMYLTDPNTLPAGSLYNAQLGGSMYNAQLGGSMYCAQPGGSMYQAGGSMYNGQPGGSMYNAQPVLPHNIITVKVTHPDQPDPVVPTRPTTPPRPKTEVDIAYEKATEARRVTTNYAQSAEAASYRFLKQPTEPSAAAHFPSTRPVRQPSVTAAAIAKQTPATDATAPPANSTNFDAVYTRMYGRAPPHNPNECVTKEEADKIFASGGGGGLQRQETVRRASGVQAGASTAQGNRSVSATGAPPVQTQPSRVASLQPRQSNNNLSNGRYPPTRSSS